MAHSKMNAIGVARRIEVWLVDDAGAIAQTQALLRL
jgi:hypothetical protein